MPTYQNRRKDREKTLTFKAARSAKYSGVATAGMVL